MKKFNLIFVNSLTLVRIIGAFVVLALDKTNGILLGILTVLIYFTDVVDGVYARHFKCATFLGALLDSVADKLFTIVSFIVLYKIVGELALVPIIIELIVLLMQFIKYALNMNIKSNVVGKLKVWIMAITIVTVYFANDLIENPNYVYILTPAIIFELLTFLSYLLEFFFPKNLNASLDKRKKIKKVKLSGKEKWHNFVNVWINPEFYEKHKDESKLRELRLESKNNIS